MPVSIPQAEIERFAKGMLDKNVNQKWRFTDHSMFREVKNLIQKGLVKKTVLYKLRLGYDASRSC